MERCQCIELLNVHSHVTFHHERGRNARHSKVPLRGMHLRSPGGQVVTVLTVTLNAAIDKRYDVAGITIGAVQRVATYRLNQPVRSIQLASLEGSPAILSVCVSDLPHYCAPLWQLCSS